MNLLLDTHVALWFLIEFENLSPLARKLSAKERNICIFRTLYLSYRNIGHSKAV